MKSKIGRFLTFISQESFLAFVCYLSFIAMLMNLPTLANIICTIISQSLVLILLLNTYAQNFISNNTIKKLEIRNSIKQEVRKIAKELLMFMPIFLISKYMINFIMVGEPVNQTDVNELLRETPIYSIMCVIIIGPIIEEFVFRFIPSKFIKNKVIYIIVTAVVFAGMHVINDTNPLYYIWFYMVDAIYYGYRYYKTKDMWVTVSMHSFNNIIATLLLFG